MKHPLAEILTQIRNLIDESKPVTSIKYPQIVDEVNYLRELKSVVETREKRLLDSLKERLNLESITEELPIVGKISKGLMVIPVKQMRLDNDLVKQEQGELWFQQHCKEVKFIQIRTMK